MNLLKRLISLSLLWVSLVTWGGDKIRSGEESQSDLDNRLVEAVFYPNVEEATKWITQGANVNAVVDYLPISYRAPGGGRTNIHNWTPLMFAADTLGIGNPSAKQGEAMVIAKILIAHGALVNQADTEGRTPLTIAVKNNDIEMAKLLLKAGANPNMAYTRTRDVLVIESTPLVDAIRNNNPDLVGLLLDNGAQADMIVQNSLGDFTALDVQIYNPKIIKVIEARLSFWQKGKWKARRFWDKASNLWYCWFMLD